ncbi:MAG: prolipoprotein diacylglyceryl transferase family protein [Acidobacteriaceae bacterium]
MCPHLFTFGPVTVPSYGVFAAIALVAGLILAMRTAARLRLPPDALWNLGLVTVFAAVLGSKLLLIVGHWHDFLSYPLLMLTLTVPKTVDSVLTELGLGIFAGLLYMTLRRMPWLSTLDAAAPGWALGQAILALGCFFAGCNYGRPTSLPWGIAFHSSWAASWNGTPLGIRLQPVQLYLCALQLALCLLSLWWLPRRKQPGELAGIWMLLFGLVQFFLDFYHGDNRLLILAETLSLTQAIDFFLVVLGALLLLEQRSNAVRTA